MGGATYHSYTKHNLGWGDSTPTFSSPTMYAGDSGICIQWGSDGRQTKPPAEWPNGTLITLAAATASGGAWTTNNTISYTHTPGTGVQTIGWAGSEYQSYMNALRVYGLIPQAPIETDAHHGYGIGGGGSWVYEAASANVVSPFCLAVSSYGVASSNNPAPNTPDNPDQTRINYNQDSGRGWAWGYTHEGAGGATPRHAWHRGSTAGTYDNSGAFALFNGTSGGVTGIIIMEMRRFTRDFLLGLIPPWQFPKRWERAFGQHPPIGTPVMESICVNVDGEVLHRWESDLKIGKYSFYKEADNAKKIRDFGNALTYQHGSLSFGAV